MREVNVGVNVGKTADVRVVFKYGARRARKGGDAEKEGAKNKFASARGGERSGMCWKQSSVQARQALRRRSGMYRSTPDSRQSGELNRNINSRILISGSLIVLTLRLTTDFDGNH